MCMLETIIDIKRRERDLIVLHKNGLRKQRTGLLIPVRMTIARDDLISFDSSQCIRYIL